MQWGRRDGASSLIIVTLYCFIITHVLSLVISCYVSYCFVLFYNYFDPILSYVSDCRKQRTWTDPPRGKTRDPRETQCDWDVKQNLAAGRCQRWPSSTFQKSSQVISVTSSSVSQLNGIVVDRAVPSAALGSELALGSSRIFWASVSASISVPSHLLQHEQLFSLWLFHWSKPSQKWLQSDCGCSSAGGSSSSSSSSCSSCSSSSILSAEADFQHLQQTPSQVFTVLQEFKPFITLHQSSFFCLHVTVVEITSGSMI